MFDRRNYFLRLRKCSEVAVVGNYGKLPVRDDLEGLYSMPEADKIVVAENDQNRRF